MVSILLLEFFQSVLLFLDLMCDAELDVWKDVQPERMDLRWSWDGGESEGKMKRVETMQCQRWMDERMDGK